MEFQEDIVNCLKILEQGGIILYPTDTIWGLGCDASNSVAIENIFNLKQREDHKSMIILIPEIKDIYKYVYQPNEKSLQFQSGVKEPTTVIYEGAINLPSKLIGKDGSIAIRLTSDPFCKFLASGLGRPLVSSSANISGEPTPSIFNEISSLIKNEVDYIVHYRQNDYKRGKSSRIVRFHSDGQMQIIRD